MCLWQSYPADSPICYSLMDTAWEEGRQVSVVDVVGMPLLPLLLPSVATASSLAA